MTCRISLGNSCKKQTSFRGAMKLTVPLSSWRRVRAFSTSKLSLYWSLIGWNARCVFNCDVDINKWPNKEPFGSTRDGFWKKVGSSSKGVVASSRIRVGDSWSPGESRIGQYRELLGNSDSRRVGNCNVGAQIAESFSAAVTAS